MAEQIRLEVVTPDKMLLSEDVDIVVANGVEGEFGVLNNHIPFLTTLQEGELRYRVGSNLNYMAVSGGFAEVLPDRVSILAESAEMAREIDIDRARKARERAEQRLAQAKADDIEYIRAEAALKRALVRLKVADKAKSGL
ncbi:MAG: F0F1 ATP synthase subunit epsilon [Thermodesulfobacteriota bacterium]|nr:F0F1 ATP synthase subunit epsilon [Thermodesulfobacteriota bacterium]